ncbi:MAG: hypothetical protein ABFS10_14120 [Bacteroidota bacterium]
MKKEERDRFGRPGRFFLSPDYHGVVWFFNTLFQLGFVADQH